MARLISTAVLALALTALLAGCSGSGEEPEPDPEAGAQAALEAYFTAMNAADGVALCDLLTENGQDWYATGGEDLCADPQPSEGSAGEWDGAPQPEVIALGADDDVAMALIQYPGDYEESFVTLLRREDGAWKVDIPNPYPIPPSLALEGADIEPMITELPDGGDEGDAVRDVAGRFITAKAASDGAEACSLLTPEARERIRTGVGAKISGDPDPCENIYGDPVGDAAGVVADVAVTGDVALAYIAGAATAETVDGQTQSVPPGDLEEVIVLVRTPDGWRIDPVSLGYA
jgi:hypothetical protein